MTPRTRANLALFMLLTMPFWAVLFYLTVLYLLVPVIAAWAYYLGWLGTLPFWWVRP